tara:strand:- start:21 stop:329 length:309 start_codon:yes stop_codon:yes gene_type:complete
MVDRRKGRMSARTRRRIKDERTRRVRWKPTKWIKNDGRDNSDRDHPSGHNYNRIKPSFRLKSRKVTNRSGFAGRKIKSGNNDVPTSHGFLKSGMRTRTEKKK